MQELIDLHTHSTASDGSMTPAELVRHAKAIGLAAVAVTDHDTVDGVEEAIVEAEKIGGIEVVAGLEISTDYKPEMHVLGYFWHKSHLRIKDVLHELKESRERRNPKIVKKLNELGFRITMEEVRAEAGGNIIGRPHIAKVLINKGYVSSMSEAFEKYLGGGRPAYFKKDKLTPGEGIQAIRRAGGVPVLAHPILLGLVQDELDQLLGKLAADGLAGIEAIYVENTAKDTSILLKLAKKHKLLATGGSDFHGSFKPDIELGRGHGQLKIPYELLRKLKESAGVL